jgi:hypothetical protein
MLSNMDDPTTERALRAARRRETWSLSVHTLADAPPSQRTSPEVALASIWRLSCECWAMSGRPWPDYTRANMPGRVLRSPPTPQASGTEDSE